jgi:hypothetical protein
MRWSASHEISGLAVPGRTFRELGHGGETYICMSWASSSLDSHLGRYCLCTLPALGIVSLPDAFVSTTSSLFVGLLVSYYWNPVHHIDSG